MSSDIKYVLAIDLGTSGPKVALVSVWGDILDHEFEKTDTIFLPGGGVEENPDDWWNAIVKATTRLLSFNFNQTTGDFFYMFRPPGIHPGYGVHQVIPFLIHCHSPGPLTGAAYGYNIISWDTNFG